MRIATWNINSLTVRLPQVLDWLNKAQPDVLALQETKIIDANFPSKEIEAIGYQACYSGQKTYNGVAILSKRPGTEEIKDVAGLLDQRRILAATYGGVRVLNVYVPNGESVESDKYQYKLRWLRRCIDYVSEELTRHPRLVILGDFNIAPEARDVPDPALWEGKVLFSEPERTLFQRLLAVGLRDAFRLFTQPDKQFSWWDYRMNAFRRNLGLRIDHILISAALSPQCLTCYIDKEPRTHARPSDHVPVIAEFQLQEERL